MGDGAGAAADVRRIRPSAPSGRTHPIQDPLRAADDNDAAPGSGSHPSAAAQAHVPVRSLLVLIVALLPGLAAATPSAASFDRLFLRIDDGEVPSASLEEMRSATRRLEAVVPPGDARRARLFRTMRCALDFRREPQAGVRYAEAGREEALQAGDIEAAARFEYCRGFKLELFDEKAAWQAYDAGLRLATRAEDSRLTGDGLIYRGSLYSLRGDQALALQDFLRAQETYERAGLDRRAEGNLINIGIAYRRMRDFDRALDYLRQMEAFARRTGSRVDLYSALMQQGYAFEEQGLAVPALRMFSQALEIAVRIDRVDEGYARIGLASAHVVAGDGARAFAVIEQARRDLAVDGTDRTEPMLDYVAGLALALQARHREALQRFARAEPLMRRQDNDRYLVLLYRARAISAEAVGDARAALADLHRHDVLARRLRADAEGEQVTSWRMRFDANRRAVERQRLELERARHEQQIRALERERPWRRAALAIGIALIGLLAVLMALQWRTTRRVRLLAMTDPLTGLANRRRILLAGEQAVQAATAARPLSLVSLDLDHFKRVNDAHGHPLGDRVLEAVATTLASAMRREDRLGRIGGEEFLALLPATPLADARVIAERLRAAVSALELGALAPGLAVRLSAGVAQWRPTDRDLQGLMRRADAALYRAKQAGRDRVESDD